MSERPTMAEDPKHPRYPAGCLQCGNPLKPNEGLECNDCPITGYSERATAWWSGARDFPRPSSPPSKAAPKPASGQRWRWFDHEGRDMGVCTVVAVEGEIVKMNDGSDGIECFPRKNKDEYGYEFVDHGDGGRSCSTCHGVHGEPACPPGWGGTPSTDTAPRAAHDQTTCMYCVGGVACPEVARALASRQVSSTGPGSYKNPSTGRVAAARDEKAAPFREVSTSGKPDSWLPFNGYLSDADSFDAYRHRRVDGVEVAVAEARGYWKLTFAEHARMDAEARSLQDDGDKRRREHAKPKPPALSTFTSPDELRPGQRHAYFRWSNKVVDTES